MSSVTARDHDDSDARRFGLLVDAVSDYAIYMLDPEGFITSWNTGAQRIEGYSSEEIIGQHFSRFFTRDDLASRLPERILMHARSAGLYEAEGWRVRKDGSRFWASATIHPVPDDDGTLIGFAEITRDITDRVNAQKALLEGERRFRLLVDAVVDYAIYMLDPTGVITNWNTGAERLKGYAADEIVGQHFSKFYLKEERAAGLPIRALETAAREGRYEAEGWRVRKDGSRFWASVVIDAIRAPDGSLFGFAKITRDITERRAALEALRESERQLRLLIAGVIDYGIFMLDPNGIVASWNAGAERIKGYTAAEIVGQHFSRFYTEPDRAAGLPARALETAAREGRFEREGWRVRKDGSLFWANVVIDAIRDERGGLTGYAKITRDITERREAQLALQEAQTQRAHAQKIEALGQLTGGVAHDFNNLLMIVSGNVEIIKRAAGDNPKVARAAEAIGLAAGRGVALTRQLLTFSRRQTFNPTVVALVDRIASLRTMLASLLGSQVKLSMAVAPDAWPVQVDPSEFELALVNVALNARDAMPEGGVITLSAENVTLSRRETKAGIEGEFVALRIADTGCGIPPDLLPKVFDPYFTTKQMDKGTGLGLSQVHGFAHQSGGTVAVESELGRGTTVTLYLPRADAVRADAAPEESEEASSSGGNVLAVEDDPEVLAVSVSMLRQLGYRVRAVASAAVALEAIATEDFDLVLSDVVMAGGMDGVGLARAIRERKPGLPVLLVTGYAQKGAIGPEFTVMRKPYQISDLSRVAARMIAQSKQPAGANLVRLSDVRGAGVAGIGEKQ